jgi:hypothetical protein
LAFASCFCLYRYALDARLRKTFGSLQLLITCTYGVRSRPLNAISTQNQKQNAERCNSYARQTTGTSDQEIAKRIEPWFASGHEEPTTANHILPVSSSDSEACRLLRLLISSRNCEASCRSFAAAWVLRLVDRAAPSAFTSEAVRSRCVRLI